MWVKREDRAGTVYGGNKVRKLEWLLGDALEIGGDVLSIGAVGSHHLLATAVYGSRQGIHVHGVVTPQPDHPHVRENARALGFGMPAPLWPAAAIALMTIGVNLIVDWILSINARPSGASAEM